MTAAMQPREDAVQQRQLAPLRSSSLDFQPPDVLEIM